MRQFDVVRNANPVTSSWAPYLLVLQSDLLDQLKTVVVAPLVDAEQFGHRAKILNPEFEVEGRRVILSVAELSGVSRSRLGASTTSLAEQHQVIVAALDLLFTGF